MLGWCLHLIQESVAGSIAQYSGSRTSASTGPATGDTSQRRGSKPTLAGGMAKAVASGASKLASAAGESAEEFKTRQQYEVPRMEWTGIWESMYPSNDGSEGRVDLIRVDQKVDVGGTCENPICLNEAKQNTATPWRLRDLLTRRLTMYIHELPIYPFETPPIRGDALEALSWDHLGMLGYAWVYIGICRGAFLLCAVGAPYWSQ